MDIFDFQKLRWLLQPRGIEVDDGGKANFKEGSNAIVDLGIPTNTRLVSPFVVFLSKSIPEGPRLYDFRGAVLWIGAHGIWDLDLENSTQMMFESMRAGREKINDAPGQIYGPDEWVPFHASLMLALITGWDALVILEESAYLMMLSHDDYVRIVFKDDVLADSVRRTIKDPNALIVQSPPWKPVKT